MLIVLIILHREACSHNLRARVKGMFFGFLGLLLPFVLLINFLASSSARGTLNGIVGNEVADKLHTYTVSTTPCLYEAINNVLQYTKFNWFESDQDLILVKKSKWPGRKICSTHSTNLIGDTFG